LVINRLQNFFKKKLIKIDFQKNNTESQVGSAAETASTQQLMQVISQRVMFLYFYGTGAFFELLTTG